jgi:hypothetical protein
MEENEIVEITATVPHKLEVGMIVKFTNKGKHKDGILLKVERANRVCESCALADTYCGVVDCQGGKILSEYGGHD